MDTKGTKEIIESIKNVRDAVMFLTESEAAEIVKEHNSKSPHKMKIESNPDGSFTITEEKSGINITVEKSEIQG